MKDKASKSDIKKIIIIIFLSEGTELKLRERRKISRRVNYIGKVNKAMQQKLLFPQLIMWIFSHFGPLT